MSILSVEQLTKTFSTKEGMFTVINDVSFQLAQGEILGILGPNGAGKTTIIQILLSTLTPTSGKISYFGKDFFRNRSQVLEHISFASSYVKLPSQLKVRENLDIYAQLYGVVNRTKRISEFLDRFGIGHLANKETGLLSAGEMTRVMLIKAFIGAPKIVLLDEPTASLDPDIAHEVRSFIMEQQKENNVSIVITSHNMDEVTEICSRVLVLRKGTIIADDTPQNLARSVSRAHIKLIPEDTATLTMFLEKNELSFKHEGNCIFIEINEQDIAPFLMRLADNNIRYTQISIEEPSLEDYFIAIAQDRL